MAQKAYGGFAGQSLGALVDWSSRGDFSRITIAASGRLLVDPSFQVLDLSNKNAVGLDIKRAKKGCSVCGLLVKTGPSIGRC